VAFSSGGRFETCGVAGSVSRDSWEGRISGVQNSGRCLWELLTLPLGESNPAVSGTPVSSSSILGCAISRELGSWDSVFWSTPTVTICAFTDDVASTPFSLCWERPNVIGGKGAVAT
jgi:hypothetical protein